MNKSRCNLSVVPLQVNRSYSPALISAVVPGPPSVELGPRALVRTPPGFVFRKSRPSSENAVPAERKRLVELGQSGEDRARYGEQLLSNLAADLKAKGPKGLGISILKNCRQFYRIDPQIRQSVIGEFERR
jgi:hypothetical protein